MSSSEGGEPREDEDVKFEMSEEDGSIVIDAYWNGEAPGKILEREKSPFKDKVEKDW
jgi:hypothetical protein